MKNKSINKTLRYALLFAGLTSLPAMAHISYGGRDFGSFTGTTAASSTISNQAATGWHGWIDGTDADWGDSHRLRAFRFHLDNDADVQISFKEQVWGTALGGIMPGFTVYKGLAHLAPLAADYDTAPGSVAIRDTDSGGAVTEGSFRALNDWRITNDNDDPASVFTYVGHAYDGTGIDYGTGVISGADGLADHSVSKVFHLAAGDYSIFVGGTDYFNDATPFPSLGIEGMVAVVPEPETYAMLLAGLGLLGVSVSRRRSIQNERV
ncbi:FxDxF family PEP-CTERM protein [Nitrosomonas sp.]|uniref:FxDxF family PEP-CTERM protein n=1 Tax=Nitrosomonas sp. TaxID=42353 RepID=UPI001D47C057|nr:FxDxF family PEP-CTERM protein [Nitrosomonas sp.]MBX3616176.1 FxDxF family PEP-CTERM protein [Nitrosomonas sp.]